jgi:acetolactate synthase-1/2/3 large subunit
VNAFQKTPTPIVHPGLDPETAERIVAALAGAERPVIYAGGGVLSSRATAELTALADALEVPVAHTLMGKGCLHERHPLLLGQTGFWGLPVANEACKRADLIVAIGTRLAEANSSSWDPRFTFAIPPTRLIHIDIDPAEIGRNYPTELGVVADAKAALGVLASTVRGRRHNPRGTLREDIARGRKEFAANYDHQWKSNQFPMRPERILSDLRRALPEDGFLVTDVGWNKNGVAQQFPITVPGTFITPSGLATMGFGPAAVLGVKMAFPHRAAVAAATAVQRQSVRGRDRDGSGPARGLGDHGQRRLWHDRGPLEHALRLELRLPLRASRQDVPHRLRRHGAVVRCAGGCD